MGSKLDRKEAKIFASNCDNTLVTQFRTESADGSTASYSRDPDVIQNSNYEQGWVEDTNNLNTKIYGEDMNAVGYVQSYLLKYLYENGIPEWSPTTEYFEHSIARIDNRLFISLTDNNINNNPTSTVGEWQEIPLSAINITTSGSGSSIFNSSTGNDITLKSLSVDGYASLEDNGDQINIHVLGGSGIVDAYWGQIQGTLTNQADLVSALGAKQDNLTFNSPLSVDINNEVSIPEADTNTSGYLSSTDWNTFNGKQDELSGLTHTYTSGTDTVELYPSATNSNIGTSQYPITNINASNVNAPVINSGALFNLNGDISIRCQDGDSIEIGTDGSGSSKRLEVSTSGVTVNGDLSITGTASTDKIQGKTTATSVETGASIVPDTDNTLSLGGANTRYKELYVDKIGKVSEINNDSGASVNITGATHKYLNGNTVHIYPETRTDSITIGNYGDSGSEYTGTIRIYNNYAGIRVGRYTYSGSGIDGLHVSGRLMPTTDNTNKLGGAGARWSEAYATNFYGTYNPPSDRNKKDNIVERGTRKSGGSSLQAINDLKTYSYTFKDDSEKKTHIGIMAQELREVEPLLVSNKAEEGSKEEDLYYDLGGYCTLLTEAIKELSAKVESLEARVKELESNKEELKK